MTSNAFELCNRDDCIKSSQMNPHKVNYSNELSWTMMAPYCRLYDDTREEDYLMAFSNH